MLCSEYRTQCGGRLVVPPKTRDHLAAHPEVAGLLEEVAGLLTLPRDGSFVAREVELGRLVGRTGCVAAEAVGLTGPAMFAVRAGRRKASRVVVGAQGPEVSTVVVLAFAAKEAVGTYVLITSYVGALAPKEPWDAAPGTERDNALEFWGKNALVHDPAVMGEPFQSTWAEIISA